MILVPSHIGANRVESLLTSLLDDFRMRSYYCRLEESE
jgi:hypothetical protein